MTTEGQIFCSVPEACQRLGIGTTKGWALVHSGEIPSARIGDRVLVPVDGLRSWAESKVSATVKEHERPRVIAPKGGNRSKPAPAPAVEEVADNG